VASDIRCQGKELACQTLLLPDAFVAKTQHKEGKIKFPKDFMWYRGQENLRSTIKKGEKKSPYKKCGGSANAIAVVYEKGAVRRLRVWRIKEKEVRGRKGKEGGGKVDWFARRR